MGTRLIAFDLDDTLAPSKSPLAPEMARLLVRLLERVHVCVISGGRFEQFSVQVIERLPPAPADALGRLHLMPTCGTQYFRAAGGRWERVYAEDLTEDEKSRATGALEICAKQLELWETRTWGSILEDRGSQVTFSALGQEAPVSAKASWDPDGSKKRALRNRVQALLPDLEVRAGGSTSIDITRRGIDKAYGIAKLAGHTGFAFDEMLFIGDRLDPAGNDFPVIRLGVPTIAVNDWHETADYLEDLLGVWEEAAVL